MHVGRIVVVDDVFVVSALYDVVVAVVVVAVDNLAASTVANVISS